MRIFHVISGFENGGVEMLIYRMASCAPQDIDMHVVAHGAPVPSCVERFRTLGITVHFIPCRKRYFAHKQALFALFMTYKPDVVHVHTTEWGYLALAAAKRAKIPVRIQHSHAARRDKNPVWALLYRLTFCWARRTATHFVACGKDAAVAAFGKRAWEQGMVFVLPNGIDTAHYAFSAVRRKEMRRALGLTDATQLIGMVARFAGQKNHKAALRIFAAYRKTHPHARLLLVGAGKLMPRVKKMAAKCLPCDAVIFYGVAEDTAPLYDAMDGFMLPSRFEGLPITLIEAQCSGLPAVVSNTVTREAAYTDLVTYLSPGNTMAWCSALQRSLSHDRVSYAGQASQNGYDFQSSTAALYAYYQKQ